MCSPQPFVHIHSSMHSRHTPLPYQSSNRSSSLRRNSMVARIVAELVAVSLLMVGGIISSLVGSEICEPRVWFGRLVRLGLLLLVVLAGLALRAERQSSARRQVMMFDFLIISCSPSTRICRVQLAPRPQVAVRSLQRSLSFPRAAAGAHAQGSTR